MADWSSLPADIVGRIGDCFLATNDLDCYMDFRAVCTGWRSATTDPKASPGDPRFHPVRWVLLDDDSVVRRAYDDYRRLFMNTATGRFLRKDLPLLRNFCFITSTGGMFVVAEKDSPHAVRVLNPFTASSIRFMAPMPDLGLSLFESVPSNKVLHATIVAGASPALVLVSESAVHSAVPSRERFGVEEYGDVGELTGILQAHRLAPEMAPADEVFSMLHWDDDERKLRRFPLQSGGESLVVIRPPDGTEVFPFKVVRLQETTRLEPMSCLGGRALFLGRRCLCVDATLLPSIKPNCIYYKEPRRGTIYAYRRAGEKEEKVWLCRRLRAAATPGQNMARLLCLRACLFSLVTRMAPFVIVIALPRRLSTSFATTAPMFQRLTELYPLPCFHW